MASARVMLLIEHMEAGGAQVLVGSLAIGLKRDGWRPFICCWRKGGSVLEELGQEGIEVHCLNLRRRSIVNLPVFTWDLLRIVCRLSQLVRRERVDLIHSHLHESNDLASLVGMLTRRPAILTVHNTQMNPVERGPGSLRNGLRRLAMRHSTRSAAAVVAVGNEVARSLRQLLGSDAPSISVIPNGVSAPPADGRIRERSRCQIQLSEGNPALVCVARMVPHKRHCDLIRAMSLVAKEYPGARLLLLGEGPEEASLRAMAFRCGVEPNIVWLGQRRDVRELLPACDLFVLPSAYEGVSLALLEAMAAGLPVVATDVPGNAEVVEHGISGLLVPAGAPDELARAILQLLNDREGARRMGQAGQRRVEREFSLDSMVRSVESLYQRILSRSGSG